MFMPHSEENIVFFPPLHLSDSFVHIKDEEIIKYDVVS